MISLNSFLDMHQERTQIAKSAQHHLPGYQFYTAIRDNGQWFLLAEYRHGQTVYTVTELPDKFLFTQV